MHTKQLQEFIRSGGYCWPGGYPSVLLMADCEVIDCKAARENYRQVRRAMRDLQDMQWRPVGVEIHWEGPPLICAHSGREVQSAYGETES